MFYIVDRVAELRHEDLRNAAQRKRQARVFVGQRFNLRRSAGRFLVRVGSHLSGEPRQEPRLAGVGESG